MISPLGKGHKGGALNISNGSTLDGSWGEGGGDGAEGSAAAALGSTVTAAARVEVPAGGVGLWRTRSRKE